MCVTIPLFSSPNWLKLCNRSVIGRRILIPDNKTSPCSSILSPLSLWTHKKYLEHVSALILFKLCASRQLPYIRFFSYNLYPLYSGHCRKYLIYLLTWTGLYIAEYFHTKVNMVGIYSAEKKTEVKVSLSNWLSQFLVLNNHLSLTSKIWSTLLLPMI